MSLVYYHSHPESAGQTLYFNPSPWIILWPAQVIIYPWIWRYTPFITWNLSISLVAMIIRLPLGSLIDFTPLINCHNIFYAIKCCSIYTFLVMLNWKKARKNCHTLWPAFSPQVVGNQCGKRGKRASLFWWSHF